MTNPDAPHPRQGILFGPFRLLAGERLLEMDGNPVPLGSRAFDLLVALAERAGDVVGKEELISRAWPDLTVDESNLRFHIAGLRKALGDGRNGARYVTNVPGRGYCLVAPTTLEAAVVAEEAIASDGARAALCLPHRLTRMIGRDDSVHHICEQLAARRFVTIHGPGGIGKTTVAVAAAHGLLEAFGGDVLFLDLAPLTDPALVGSALASALAIMAKSADPTSEIIDFLRDRRMLLVFDSCEHVIGALALLAERIYQEAPQISILATSRERLRVEGEHVIALPPLDRPPDGFELTAAHVLNFSATHLFAERAASIGYDVAFTDADAAVVAEICRKLDGIALAIELVAARVAAHGLRETEALLDSRLKLLWRGRRTALPRHQTLNATIDWSYELISEAEKTVLRRLAVFVGPFALAAAEAVVSDDRLEAIQVVQALEELAAKSLVSIQESDGVAEYRLLDTTREYARGKLVEAGELDALAGRHAAYVLGALREGSASSKADSPAQARQNARVFLGDVNAALGWSFSDRGDPELAVRLAAAAARLFTELSLLNECRRWSGRALSTLDESLRGTTVEMELNAALGSSMMFTEGNGDEALEALEQALEAAEQLDDLPSQFRLLSRLHMYHRRTGKIAVLAPISGQAETLAARIGDPVAIAAAHTLLGVTHHLAGDQVTARTHLETALHMEAFRHVAPGHFAFHRNPFIALSRCMWLQGYPDQAISAARPLATAAAAPDAVTYCISLIWGAAVFRWVGDWQTYDALAERLRTHAASRSLRPYQAVGLGMQGESLIRAGQVDAGIELLRSAIGVLRNDHYELYLSHFCASLALGMAERGDTGEARDLIDATLASIADDGETLESPELFRIRGEIEARQGDAEGARASFHEAISIAERQGTLSWQLRSETSLARLELRLDGGTAAKERLEATYSRFTEGFDTADLKAARALLDRLAATAE